MAAPPDDRKTDYFGTFLDTLSRGVTQVAAALPSQSDLRDTLLHTLAQHGGVSSVTELLAPPFTTIGLLISVAQDLQNFGLVEASNGAFRLTTQGAAAADKLNTMPNATSPPSTF